MIRNFFKEYFSFSRGEKNGTVVLCFILLIVMLFPHIYGFLVKPASYPADPDFLAEIEAFYHSAETGQETITATVEIRADDQKVEKKKAKVQVKDSLPALIDLNRADTLELMQIKGIGPVFSRRILRYRNILGGYYHTSQLKEVYGIDGERFLEISPRLFADTSMIKKLRPATDDFSILLRHPYLDYEQVSQIFRLRDAGKLDSIEDLLTLPDFTERDINRLYPYLVFDSGYSGQ